MICIVDYQMGNLHSVQKAFEHVGHPAVVTNSPRMILQADKIVLPGVGAFRDAARELHARGLADPIRQSIAEGRQFLGICLGLQLLFDVSYEDGQWQGLGIVPGSVEKFSLPSEFKVPHMGWNQVLPRTDSPLLRGISREAYFYFVHSYYVKPAHPDVVAAEAVYGDPFCCMISRDNVHATQFHPEKSQQVGLQLIKNFGDLA